jgi:hypothetical protein
MTLEGDADPRQLPDTPMCERLFQVLDLVQESNAGWATGPDATVLVSRAPVAVRCVAAAYTRPAKNSAMSPASRSGSSAAAK